MSLTVTGNPAQGSIIYDADPNVITITSSNGQGYYFRIQVLSGATLIRFLALSRISENVAELDLQYLFRSLLGNDFNHSTVTNLVFIGGLVKRMDLRIEEYRLDDNQLMQSLTLSHFFVAKSIKKQVSQSVEVANNFEIKGGPMDYSKVPADAVLRIPIMVNHLVSESQSNFLRCRVSDGSTDLFDQTYEVSSIGAYRLQMNLAQLDLSGLTQISVIISMPGSNLTITKFFTVVSKSLYLARAVVFENNFGYWIYAYLFGRRSEDDRFKREEYHLEDTNYRTLQVDQEHRVSINTGHLLSDQQPIINEICGSKCHYLIFNNKFERYQLLTSRTSGLTDNQHIYNQELEFSIMNP